MNISLINICKSYGDKKILDNFCYEFDPGSITIINGLSGIGKTTLLNIILGIEEADSGRLIKNNIIKTSGIFQEDRLIENISAKKNVELVLDKEKKINSDKISMAFAELGLENEENTVVSKLSGGMKRRIALIRGILYPSDLIVMDEPFKGLDEENRRIAINFIKKNLGNRILIVASHDLRDAKELKGKTLNL